MSLYLCWRHFRLTEYWRFQIKMIMLHVSPHKSSCIDRRPGNILRDIKEKPAILPQGFIYYPPQSHFDINMLVSRKINVIVISYWRHIIEENKCDSIMKYHDSVFVFDVWPLRQILMCVFIRLSAGEEIIS